MERRGGGQERQAVCVRRRHPRVLLGRTIGPGMVQDALQGFADGRGNDGAGHVVARAGREAGSEDRNQDGEADDVLSRRVDEREHHRLDTICRRVGGCCWSTRCLVAMKSRQADERSTIKHWDKMGYEKTFPQLESGYYGVPKDHLVTIVTYLEMLERPEGGAPPLREDLAIGLEEMMPLDRYRRLFRRVGEPWLWSSRLRMSDAELAAEIHDAKVEVWTAVHPGETEPAGIFELDFRKPGECEIQFFALVPGFTGRGVGSWLMGNALHRAWGRDGVARVHLHTCHLDSPPAMAFYLKMGFKAFARSVEVKPDPRAEGILSKDVRPVFPIL
ncbi:acyl-CoA N-acyltransferase [Hyaloraphidium curvatum]|nr:acyl-CoA N-acyltransferase [Hyaloraphidium curvatum]